MHPAFLDNMSWEMAEVYGAITDQIMINLARHFPFYEYVSDVPTSAFAYQAKMLAQMGQVNKETIRIIRNGLEDADLALQGVLEQAIVDAVKGAEPDLLEAVKKGVFMPPQTPVVAPNQMRAFQLYYEQAANKLNMVNTVMLESTQSAYQQMISDVVNEFDVLERINRTQIALDTAAGETITGVSSWNQALKHATDRLKEGGITGFVDHAGRQWSAEAYVAMDIRTTVFNTGRAAVWETNQDFGNDLYLVSYHDGARPLCYPWQNKVISATDNARTVQDLDGNTIQVIAQSDTSYGEPAGLFGINCKHYPTPFIPGVSVADGKPQDPEANERTYKESQEQRRLERKLREEKRDLQMMKAQGAPEDQIAKQREKVRQSSADIDDFCKETGRARHRDREAVYTKREFPDADRYDVTQFKKDQQNLIREYYDKGGEQQGFTFGQMTPKEQTTPIVPQQTPQTVPVVPSVPASNGIQPQKTSVNDTTDFATLKKYMKDTHGIDVSTDVEKLDFETVRETLSGFEHVVSTFPEVGTSIKNVVTSKSGVMSCNGTEITFNPKYYTNRQVLQDTIDRQVKSGYWPKNTTPASIGVHETAHGVEQVLIDLSGKYTTPVEKILAWNDCTEAKLVRSDATKAIKKTEYGKGKKNAELIQAISGYANDSASETMAESFADVFANGENSSPLSKEIRQGVLNKYNTYKNGGVP